MPVSPLPDPEAERRGLRSNLADRRRSEPERAGADGSRRRATRLRIPDEQAVERGPVEARAHLSEERRSAGHRRGSATRAVHRAVESRAICGVSRLRGCECDPGRGHVRLDATVEGEAERREARDLAPLPVRVGVLGPDRDSDIEPGPSCGEQLDRRRRRDDHDGRGLVLGDPERPGWKRGAVEDDCGRTRARRCDRCRLRIGTDRYDHRPAGHDAEPLGVEVVDALRAGEPPRRTGSRNTKAQRVRRRHGAEQRQLLVEDHVEPAAQDDSDARQVRARIGCADRQRPRRPGRTGDRTERRAGTAVVARGGDHDRVQAERALDRLGLGTVGEGGVRLRHAQESHADSVVGVSVAIRVDRALEPCNHLIGAREHDVAPVCGGLPACDANGQDRRTGSNAVQAARPAGADQNARELGPVPFGLRRVLRIHACCCVVAVADDVDAGQHPAPQVGMSSVDAGVEERDRHAASIEARQLRRRHDVRWSDRTRPL